MAVTVISPISIDLGAKFTGVHCVQYYAGTDVTEEPSGGAVVVTSDQITLSQTARRTKRHQRRSAQRHKLARRLLFVVMKEKFGLDPLELDRALQEQILGLLKRRGFSYYAEDDFDDTPLLSVDAEIFEQLFPSSFSASEPLIDQLNRLLGDVDEAERLSSQANFGWDKKTFKQKLPDIYKDDWQELWAAYSSISDQISGFVRAKSDGHLPRKTYLKNIREDISNSSELLAVLELHGLSTDRFANLVGNISNLQLRVLRKYFNDPKMAKGDYWSDDRFSKYFWRWLKSWRCDQGSPEKVNWYQLMAQRKESAIDVLVETDPAATIPPYEDQNNRRPPKCLSVLLTPEKLDQKYPDWRRVTDILISKYRHVAVMDGLETVVDADLASILMRILDCSKAHDPIGLRYLATQRTSNTAPSYIECLSKLTLVLGGDSERFVGFSAVYYSEVDLARSGIWSEDKNAVLTRCDSTPPQKVNIRSLLLGQILSSKISDAELEHFMTKVWESRARVGRRTFKGWCKLCAQLQKDYGINLKSEYEVAKIGEKNGEKLSAEQKELIMVFEHSELVAKFAKEALEQTVESHERFANPFSLAQLYNVLEVEPKGFSKSCKQCSHENQWRMVMKPDHDGKMASHGVRMSIDSGRPFDGMVDRLSQSIAAKIVHIKSGDFKRLADNDCSIHIPILVEENRFQFSEQLIDVKRDQGVRTQKRKKDQVEQRLEESRVQFDDKFTRIRAASNNFCPYTGSSIGSQGEIDHIIPRSYSRKLTGTIFNHEANLIYCSSKGNYLKGDSPWTVARLHERYLQAQFSESDPNKVSDIIRAGVDSIGDIGKAVFIGLTTAQQRAVRHALFVPDLRDQLIGTLHQQTKTRVNGTQAWLVKRIIQKLRDLPELQSRLDRVSFSAHFISPDLVSAQRRLLADINPVIKKTDFQSAASHVVDAAMVLSAALDQAHTAEIMQTVSSESFEKPDWRGKLLPEVVDVQRIESRPKYRKSELSSAQIFKDGILGESFLPILVNGEGVYIGFDVDSAILVESADTVFNALSPFLDFRNEPFNGTLDELQTLPLVGMGKAHALTINRRKAFDFLALIAKRKAAPDELRVANLLDSIRYVTQKTSVKSAVYDVTKNAFFARDVILKEKDFTVKVSYSEGRGGDISPINGKIIIPARDMWARLLDINDVKENLGEKVKLDPKTEKAIRDFFLSSPVTPRAHQRVRKDFSLPRIKTASGGFRVRRKAFSGDDVWQTIEIEGAAAAGFDLDENGVPDFKSSSLIEALADAKNLIPLNGRYESSAEGIVYNDEWRSLTVPSDAVYEGLSMAPNSSSRCRMRMTLAWDSLLKFLSSNTEFAGNHPFELRAELKLNDSEKKAWGEWVGSYGGQPRGNLQVISLGQRVTVEYIVSGTNAEMKEGYRQGKVVR
jgi:CRISPR system subtype II-B RNA-guided endonuclease Cas9/Csx12